MQQMLIALASNIRMFQSRGSAPSWPTTRTTRSCSRRLLLLTTNSSIDKRAPDLAQSGKKKWRKHLQLTKTPIHPTTHLYKIPGPTDGSVPPPSFPSAAAAAAAVIISAGGTAVARADGRTDGRGEGIGTDTAKETKITTSEADEMGGGGGEGEGRKGRKKGEADNAQIDTANRRFGRRRRDKRGKKRRLILETVAMEQQQRVREGRTVADGKTSVQCACGLEINY